MVGSLVVIQNVLSSLFNSTLFDFTTGWLYVIGVGIAGGMAAARNANGISPEASPQDPALSR